MEIVRKSPVRGPARAESPASLEPRATPWVLCPHSLRPERAKVEINHSPILLPFQGVGVCTLIPRALPWAGDWLPFQGARGEGSNLSNFCNGVAGCAAVRWLASDGVTTNLTNCRAARVRGIAPVRGSYSRIGACPYLPPVLIDSRFCPCKGRISLAGLAPQ